MRTQVISRIALDIVDLESTMSTPSDGHDGHAFFVDGACAPESGPAPTTAQSSSAASWDGEDIRPESISDSQRRTIQALAHKLKDTEKLLAVSDIKNR